MPELMRSMVARLRVYFGNRRIARRFRRSVSFNVSLFDPKLNREQLEHAPYLEGTTLDEFRPRKLRRVRRRQQPEYDPEEAALLKLLKAGKNGSK